MNIEHQFICMVLQLAKPGIQICQSLTPARAHQLHMAVGVSGEVAELLEGLVTNAGMDNCKEELGDIEFYLEGLARHLGLGRILANGKSSAQVPCDDSMNSLIIMSGSLLDAVKKSAIYEKDLDLDFVEQCVHNIDIALGELRDLFNFTREEVLAANIAKLGKRYNAGTYTNEAAQLRADKEGEQT